MNCIEFLRDARSSGARLSGARRVCAVAALCLAWPGSAGAVEKAAKTQAAEKTAKIEKTEAAGQPLAQAPWPESDTVLDLLRADAQAAVAGKRLERAQDWLATSAAAPQPLAPSPMPSYAAPAIRAEPSGDARDRLDVVAIYGVGQSLYADIAVNGELWRYRQGRRWPQGIDDATSEPRYSLVRIEQPCVRLRWEETQRTACLRREEGRHD